MNAENLIEARLGSPAQLAIAAKTLYQRRTFAGRHPVLTFVAGPLLTIVATFLASVLLIVAASSLVDLATGDSAATEYAPPSAFEMGVVEASSITLRFAPFALTAWFFARLGRRVGLRTWSLVACGMVAITAALFSSVVNPATSQSQASWVMGFGTNVGLDQILQAAPLSLGAWMLWRTSSRGRTELAAA